MKIAIFTDAYLDITGGVMTAVAAQKKALENAGHTVYLFSPGFKRKDRALTKLFHDHIYVVPTCRLFFKGLVPVARRPKIIEKWLLKNFAEIKDFDIFHVQYEAGCSIAGVRLAQRFKIPLVQTMHGREDMGVTGLVPFGFRTLAGSLLNRFHSWYLPHNVKIKKDDYLAPTRVRAKMWTLMVNHANQADLVLTPSAHFRKKLVDYGVERPVKVLPNGVEDTHFPEKCEVKKRSADEPLRIIWHNRATGEKRLLSFMEALKLVNGKFVMDVFGGGNELGRARRMAKRNHLPVTFHGETTFGELKGKLAKSHLDVLVSYNYDTFGMTLIEAEAFGVPAFFCDPDMKEIAAPGGFVMSKGVSARAMAEALDDLIEHPERIETMSRAMIKRRNEVKQSKRASKLIEYYKEILERTKL